MDVLIRPPVFRRGSELLGYETCTGAAGAEQIALRNSPTTSRGLVYTGTGNRSGGGFGSGTRLGNGTIGSGTRSGGTAGGGRCAVYTGGSSGRIGTLGGTP